MKVFNLSSVKYVDRMNTAEPSWFIVEGQKQSLPEEVTIQNEKEIELWDALNNLGERHRTVVVLRYFQELSVTEISEVLSIHEGTVHSRLNYARERLKNALEHLHGD